MNIANVNIKNKIYTIRKVHVMIDRDLAVFYGVKAISKDNKLREIMIVFRKILCFNL